MRQPRIVPPLLFCLIVSVATLRGQAKPPMPPVAAAPTTVPAKSTAATAIYVNPQTPAEFFARARQLSDLEASGIPFHLKATFVATGDTEFTGNGTFEEWWQSKDTWRKEATLGSYRWIQVKNGTKGTASATSEYMPLRVRQIQHLRIFCLPLPNGTDFEWKISPQVVQAGSSETATSDSPYDPVSNPLPLTQQYEFSADGVLRSYRNNDLTQRYSDFKPFGKLLFPRRIVLALRGKPIDIATVVLLETLAENDHTLFDVGTVPNLGAVPAELIGDIPTKRLKPPKLLYSAQLNYRKSKRKSHSVSVVVVECTIDTNGEVREPFVQRSDGRHDDLALEAVREATFKPGKVKGHSMLINMMLAILFPDSGQLNRSPVPAR